MSYDISKPLILYQETFNLYQETQGCERYPMSFQNFKEFCKLDDIEKAQQEGAIIYQLESLKKWLITMQNYTV
jgi:hypothetical protein